MIAWDCHKIELPIIIDPVQVKPIFEMTGTVAGKPLMLTAGVNNVTLSTEFQSGSLEILSLEGILKNQNCSINCKQSLQLKLRYRQHEFLRDTAKSILPGRMTFFRDTPDSLVLKVKNNSVLASSSNSKYTYQWTIDDKKYSDKESFLTSINPKIKSKVCLNIVHPDGSNSSQCQAIDFASLDSFPGLKVALIPIQLQSKLWTLMSRVEGVGPYKYVWDNKSVTPTQDIDIKSASNQCLTVYDNRGNVASACVDLQPEAKVKSRADFDLVFDLTQLRELTQFNTVELIYIDENGVRWSTAGNVQKPISNFEILQVNSFQENTNKQSTRKLKIAFEAEFYNSARTAIAIKAIGTMAVAFPK